MAHRRSSQPFGLGVPYTVSVPLGRSQLVLGVSLRGSGEEEGVTWHRIHPDSVTSLDCEVQRVQMDKGACKGGV